MQRIPFPNRLRALVLLLRAACPAAAILAASPFVPAAWAEGTSAETAEPSGGDIGKLPSPFDGISGNMLDFQKDGYFTILEVRFDKLVYGNEDAIVWRLKTNKPITCRHVILFFQQLRDVRFYREAKHSLLEGRKRSRVEVHWTLLFYADRITTGAANGVILRKGEIFDIWIYMNPFDVKKVTSQGVNEVVFSPSRQ